jgi:hypothetical protein
MAFQSQGWFVRSGAIATALWLAEMVLTHQAWACQMSPFAMEVERLDHRELLPSPWMLSNARMPPGTLSQSAGGELGVCEVSEQAPKLMSQALPAGHELPAAALQEPAFDGDVFSQTDALDLDPTIIQESPILQDWLQEVPDIADAIRNQPSFRTRLRVGYAQFPSSRQVSGIHVSVEDVFLIAGTGLTASGSFNRSWNDERESFGAEARYYLLPLGGYVNLAPTVGYRSLETPGYTTNGLDVGFRVLFIPSRGGGADVALSQHWVAPGSAEEVGMTSISVGYAVTPRLRLGADVEFQNSSSGQESRLGLMLEWML